MKLTFISDTHTKHKLIPSTDLPGGDIIIHSGDIMNSGYSYADIADFCEWFSGLEQYTHKIFIAGNHDRLFEDNPITSTRMVREYPNITYLQDSLCGIGDLKIWGSPWQPEFYNWAFNLPRNGEDLREKWFWIPDKTDILITHGPPWGHLDVTPYGNMNVGCELLRVRVDELKPKIHIFGHVHSGYGYKFHNGTHFINAAVLNEKYIYTNKPINVEWDKESNEIEFI
jgi:predicted phosphodiesterase